MDTQLDTAARRREFESYVRSAEESVRWYQEQVAQGQAVLKLAQEHLAQCRQWLAELDSEEAS